MADFQDFLDAIGKIGEPAKLLKDTFVDIISKS